MATGLLALNTMMLTSSVVIGFEQGPLSIVQANTLTPTGRPVTELVGEVGDVITPPPLTNDHWPVAGKIGALPARLALLAGVHSC